MTSAIVLARDSELYGRLHDAATERRCVFFAGLPGVGKSLLLQQTSLIAQEAGRRISLLQWDVARGSFETVEILARYPEIEGVTHAAIRKAAGLWARDAVRTWDQSHPDRRDVLIGEVPLIGNRLIELVQRQPDAVEGLLAGEETLFLIPVPSREVRRAIESARAREMAAPTNERELANALPTLVQAFWEEVALLARVLGVKQSRTPQLPLPCAGEGESVRSATDGKLDPGEFDPDVYAGVYERLLRHRRAERLDITSVLPVQASVYDALGAATDLVPSPDDVARVMAQIEARPATEIEREVAGWYRV
jgi:hypothetical protein